MARLKIVEKSELSVSQNTYVEKRLNAKEHIDDAGPPSIWKVYSKGVYAFVNTEEIPIGIAEASGRPICSPGWWVDQKYRRKGFGYELAEVLAEYLISDGVVSIDSISIQGNYQEQSRKLAMRFRMKFRELIG